MMDTTKHILMGSEKNMKGKKLSAKSKHDVGKIKREKMPLGKELSFAASEAYKLLRTNLMFSTIGDKSCKVIGVTSAVPGEGKTTTCINLAYTLAEADNRVLLIDGDMRLPQIARTLNLTSSVGFSNMLVGMTNGQTPIQKSDLSEKLYVITGGDIPPNPSELLGSRTAEIVMDTLIENFDYIVIDLPPVNVVSDALVISKLCGGILFVVRQDYANRREIDDAIIQLNYCNAKILGFVMTHSTVDEKGYYRKNGRYHHQYRYHYYDTSAKDKA